MDPRIDQIAPGWREAFDKKAFIRRLINGEHSINRAFLDEFTAACEPRFDLSTAVGSDAWDYLWSFVQDDCGDEYDGLMPFLEASFPGTRWFLKVTTSFSGGDPDYDHSLTSRFGVLPHADGGIIFTRGAHADGGGLNVSSHWEAPQTTLGAMCDLFTGLLESMEGSYPPHFEFDVTRDVLMSALCSLVGETPEDWAAAFRTALYKWQDYWQQPRLLERLAEVVAAERDDDPTAVRDLMESVRRGHRPALSPEGVGFERLRDLYWALFSDQGDWESGWSSLARMIHTPSEDFIATLHSALLDTSNATLRDAFDSAVRKAFLSFATYRHSERRHAVWFEHCLERASHAKVYLYFNGGAFENDDGKPFAEAALFLMTDEVNYGVIPMGTSGIIYRTTNPPAGLWSLAMEDPAAIVLRWTDREKNDVLADFIAERLRPILNDDDFKPPSLMVQNHWPALAAALRGVLEDEPSRWMNTLWKAGLSQWGQWEIDGSSLKALAEARGESLETLRTFAVSIVASVSSSKFPELTPEELERLKDLVCACYYHDASWHGVYEGPGS